MSSLRIIELSIMVVMLIPYTILASQDTIGPNGIHSLGLTTASGQPLTGDDHAIGQVEIFRPGFPGPLGDDDFAHSNTSIIPRGVFIHGDISAPPANMHINNHAEYVASVMISTNAIATGVAPSASLYASGYIGDVDHQTQPLEAAQLIANRASGQVYAINWSFGIELVGNQVLDGNSLPSLFLDWSAAHHDVLYVVAGDELNSAGFPLPNDIFNGMVVGASKKEVDGVYRRVADFNVISPLDSFTRTATTLLAPGEDIQVTGLGNISNTVEGTSVAAPHATGTVALLIQYSNERFNSAVPGFDFVRSRRHEVMKTVLMNSADKIKDDGAIAPVGSFLGMDRTVLDTDGMNWLQSEAFTDFLTPLDDEMGAGHLNAKRALRQYSSGEIAPDGDEVPVIGWDYGSTSGLDDVNKYVFNQQLLGGSYISITAAWDRVVEFDQDLGSDDFYDIGDTFLPYEDFFPHADDQNNDLDLYLMPKGATDFVQAIAESSSKDSTIDHIFAEIPTTGEYEIWVHQFDNDLGGGQAYGIAWWALGVPGTAQGNYNSDMVVDIEDYDSWRASFGSTTDLDADGNGDEIVNAADYVIWRDNLGAGSGSGTLATVPEPSSTALLAVVSLMGIVGIVRRSAKN